MQRIPYFFNLQQLSYTWGFPNLAMIERKKKYYPFTLLTAQQVMWFLSFQTFDKGGNMYTPEIEAFGPDFYICRKGFSRKFWYFKIYWEKLNKRSTEYLKARIELILPSTDELFFLGFSSIFYYTYSMLILTQFNFNFINYRYFQYYFLRPKTWRRRSKQEKYTLSRKIRNYALCQYFLFYNKSTLITCLRIHKGQF